MLIVIAWMGCAALVLKGIDIYLSSMLDEFPELRRRIALGVLVITVLLAGVFGFLIIRESANTPPLQAAYQDTQKATIKAFESISRELNETTEPVSEQPADTTTKPADGAPGE